MNVKICHYACALLFTVAGSVAVPAQTWQPAGTLPTGGAPRIYAAGVNLNGTIYALGGAPWQNSPDQDGAVHRLTGGVWSATSALDGMGPIISGAVGVDSLGRILVYGGYIDGDFGPGEAKIYDPVQGPNTNFAGRRADEAAIGYFAWAADDQGRLYGFGGGFGEGEPNSGYVDRYDAAADAWSVLAPMPTPAADACAAYDGAGYMLVFGGINAAGNSRLSNVAQYDIAANTWSDTAISDMPVALSGARAVLGADGRLYVIGGETGAIGAGITQSSVYKLDLAANSWSTVASMATPRKWFACVLGGDDYIYAIGGGNDAGGTSAAEKLLTPRCPTIGSQPQSQAAWRRTIARFGVSASGAAPFAYQWRKDGVALSNGPTGTGSNIAGADAATLEIHVPGDADLGSYAVIVSNACGSVASASAVLTLRNPPTSATQWSVTNIHPSWVDGPSYANGIGNGRIGGSGTMTTTLPDGRVMSLSHPIVWDAGLVADDITPAGSVGGGIYDVGGEFLVGWYWHTWQCWSGGQYWTCAWQSAGYWQGDPPVFHEVHMSGAEYDSVTATDGVKMVGSATWDDAVGNYWSYAILHGPPTFWGLSLHPGSAASSSSASAIDGDVQYGSFNTPYPGPVTHAAMWTGSSASFTDIHPAGYSRSGVSGASDGQAVGTAYIGNAGHAGLWVGGTFFDLNPPNSSSSLISVDDGIQIGSASPGGPGLWIGTPESYISLSDVLPQGFAGAGFSDLEVSPDGTVTIVGYGYNSATARYEALVWQSLPETACSPCDVNCDGSVNPFDIQPFIAALSGGGSCSPCSGDANQDGTVNPFDIQAFLACLGG